MRLKICLLFSLMLAAGAQLTYAAGLEVSPSRVNIVVTGLKIGQAQVLVKNPDKNVSLYDVYVDEFSDLISVSPASFTLEAGGAKNISLTASLTDTNRILKTHLSIVSRPLTDYQFKAGTGTKIPVTVSYNGSLITADQKDNTIYFGIAFVLAAFIILVLAARRYGWLAPKNKPLDQKYD